MKILSLEYHLEVYEGSFYNDPSYSFISRNPLPNISVGDYFNHRSINTFEDYPKKDEEFRVKEIDHIFPSIGNESMLEDNEMLPYVLRICLEIVQLK